MTMCGNTALLAVTAAVLCIGAASGSFESETSSEAVTLRYYLVSTSQWRDGGYSSSFRSSMAAFTSTFCGSNPASCGLSAAATFQASDVVVVSGFPQADGKHVTLQFYVEFPANSSLSSSASTAFLLPASTVKDIVGQYREELQGLADTYITYVGDTFYGIPPSSTANQVVIPLAFAVLAALLALTLALDRRRARQEREELKAVIRKRKAARVAPPPPRATEPSPARAPSLSHPPVYHDPSPQHRRRKPTELENGSSVHHQGERVTRGEHYTTLNEFREEVSPHYQAAAAALQPPSYEDTEARDRRRRERKKRRKKKQKRREAEAATEGEEVEVVPTEVVRHPALQPESQPAASRLSSATLSRHPDTETSFLESTNEMYWNVDPDSPRQLTFPSC